MTLRYARAVGAIVALACVSAPASGQSRDGGILPPGETGLVTVTGCLVRGTQVRGGKADQYVLANPRKGAIAELKESACTTEATANALMLDNTKARITESMVGHWVEISGRLEKETSTDPDNLRELDVEFAKLAYKSGK
jgi:hypothetical protein